jgi:hypothetical protein
MPLYGAFLMMAVTSWFRWSVEEEIFTQVLNAANQSIPHVAGMDLREEDQVLGILHVVHRLTQERGSVLSNILNVQASQFRDSAEHLNNPSGECASYTTILGRALQCAGFSVRKLGLEKNGRKAIHDVLEVRVNGRWALLDAYYDLAFQQLDGSLASAEQVSRDWVYYHAQTPQGYNADFDYNTFYYTNWSRIPGADKVLESFPALREWLHTNCISLRFLFLNIDAWIFGSSLAAAALLLLLGRGRLPNRLQNKPAHQLQQIDQKPTWVRGSVLELPVLPQVERTDSWTNGSNLSSFPT